MMPVLLGRLTGSGGVLAAGGRQVPARDLGASAERVAAMLAMEGLAGPGERVGIAMDNGIEWVEALFALWHLGATAVPMPLPGTFARGESYGRRLASVVADAEIRLVLVGPAAGSRTDQAVADAGARAEAWSQLMGRRPPCPARRVALGTAGSGRDIAATGPAIVQYTSGSTASPRGVVLSQANIDAALTAMTEACACEPGDVFGAWLPLYHDMGLFSVLAALSAGLRVELWRPQDFVRRPLSWLRQMGDAGVSVLAMPSFALEHLATCAARRQDAPRADLSAVRIVVSGAEPVRPSTVRRFEAAFGTWGLRRGTVIASYGLAEATLMVTLSPPGRGLRTLCVERGTDVGTRAFPHGGAGGAESPQLREVTSCGQVVRGTLLRVVDRERRVVGPGVVGLVEVEGPSVTTGYLHRELEQFPVAEDGWLQTGDVGFLFDDELYVVGREKAMFIVNGANVHAEEVEEVACAAFGTAAGRAAAFVAPALPESFGTPASDRQWAGDDAAVAYEASRTWAGAAAAVEEEGAVVVLIETRAAGPDLAGALSRASGAVSAILGTRNTVVVPVATGTIPCTSSGKVRRSVAAERWAVCRLPGSQVATSRDASEQVLAPAGGAAL